MIINSVKSVTIGKEEAGLFEYKDTGGSIEMGDKAFVLTEEDVFAGETKPVYYRDEEKAKKHN